MPKWFPQKRSFNFCNMYLIIIFDIFKVTTSKTGNYSKLWGSRQIRPGFLFGEEIWGSCLIISLIPLKKCISNCLHVIFLMDPWWNVIPEFILHFISTQITCIDAWGNHPLWCIALQRKFPIDITVSVS